jgi:hypothetical protein
MLKKQKSCVNVLLILLLQYICYMVRQSYGIAALLRWYDTCHNVSRERYFRCFLFRYAILDLGYLQITSIKYI